MNFIQKWFLTIPRPIKSILYEICYFPADTIDLLLGRQDELTPPRRLTAAHGGGNFKGIGEEFIRYFIEFAELRPNAHVLDVGCGAGRMAIPLAKYLNENGSYEGFDPMKRGVEWCKSHISVRYPNFRFQVADVYNKDYNPAGKHKAASYQFPYDNESFDFVFLTSVFTHMLPQDMENYFSEIARTLKKDGKCLITFFLLNEESKQLINARKSNLEFKYDCGGCRTTNKTIPEVAVGYDEELIRRLCKKFSLKIMEPIHYGSWCGRESFSSYQDIVVAVKK